MLAPQHPKYSPPLSLWRQNQNTESEYWTGWIHHVPRSMTHGCVIVAHRYEMRMKIKVRALEQTTQ